MFLFVNKNHRKEILNILDEFKLGIAFLLYFILMSFSPYGRQQMHGLIFYFYLSLTIILMVLMIKQLRIVHKKYKKG